MKRWMVFSSFLAVVACAGRAPHTSAEKLPDFDADPLLLLPSSAVAVGSFNARAMFENASAGASMASLGDSLVPLGAEAGFQPSRDLDRVVVAAYSTTGADVAAVLSGRFDEAKIAAATKSKAGLQVVHATYAGRATYVVGTVSYSVLTARTVVVGTRDGLRRVLERIQSGVSERSLAPWAVAALQTKEADIAAVADFVTQPVAAAAMGSLNLPWLNGMRTARILANFGPPGMNVAATLGYGDPQQALAAADGLHKADRWLLMIGPLLGGIRLQNFEATTDGNDARCKFAADDHTLVALLDLVPRLLPTTQ